MKILEELSSEKYRKDTRNKGKYNRWIKKNTHKQDRRKFKNECELEPLDK